MNRLFLPILMLATLALLAAFAACGEPSSADVRDRENEVLEYEADVESMIGYDCSSEDEIQELYDDWEDLADRHFSRYDYEDLTNGQKMSFLNDLENLLEDLEDAAKDLC